jgi:uncharacterized membrane protein
MERSDVLAALGLGAMAGMRSMSAPAFLSHRLSREEGEEAEGPLEELLSSKASAGTLAVMAVGELVADKLPGIPSRLSPPALALRLVSGAFAGATIARRHKRPVLVPALMGAAASLVSSYVLYSVRRLVTQKLRVPNVIAGFLEDALVAQLGLRLAAVLE